MDKIKAIYILLVTLFSLLPITSGAEKTMIYLEHSNTLNFDQDRLPDCQILIGDDPFSGYFFPPSLLPGAPRAASFHVSMEVWGVYSEARSGSPAPLCPQ